MNNLLKNAHVLIRAVNDPELSLSAKGLLAYICLNPDVARKGELKKACSSANDTWLQFEVAVSQLEEMGYIDTKPRHLYPVK